MPQGVKSFGTLSEPGGDHSSVSRKNGAKLEIENVFYLLL